MTHPDRALFAAIIIRAIQDAHGIATGCGSTGGSTARALRRQGDAWLRSGSRDFHWICSLAGIDGHALMQRYKAGKVRHGDFEDERFKRGRKPKGAMQ